MTQADPVAELLGVTHKMIELFVAETALLQQSDMPDLSAFVPEKSRLAARYDTLTREASRLPGEAVRGSPSFAALGDAVERLRAVAAANKRAIEIRLKAMKRVLGIVAKAARDATQPTFSYGGERLGYGARSGAAAAVAVNRLL